MNQNMAGTYVCHSTPNTPRVISARQHKDATDLVMDVAGLPVRTAPGLPGRLDGHPRRL